MLILGGKAVNDDEALGMIKSVISSGKALDKLAAFVEAQGGNKDQVYDPSLLKVSDKTTFLKADESGFIDRITCDKVGVSCMMLGGGRASKEDTIDLSVGIELLKKKGDEVAKGDNLAVIHYNDENKLSSAMDELKSAYHISSEKPEETVLIKEMIG